MKSNLTKTRLIFMCEHSKMFAVKFGLSLAINILGKKYEQQECVFKRRDGDVICSSKRIRREP
ncbi:hypothetical protein CWO27_08915 [Vibrio sp. 10N.286.51.C3]|nr:hypothetical protein CWO08_04720 [Vibrio sp. 10N.286.48.B8]PTP15267.1 hypothetical protein CWO27_08915 [Vibrio sp. 10N.286.51.C3]PTQ04274.1 hypothetical protein CWO13_08360 [Vibrio sp. ZF 223]TKE73940.1 hypothetical protein FCV45_02300 [Vibrio sp. F12]CAK3704159.1 conserved hypothetical protein [Vibrio crassostreae]